MAPAFFAFAVVADVVVLVPSTVEAGSCTTVLSTDPGFFLRKENLLEPAKEKGRIFCHEKCLTSKYWHVFMPT